MEYPSERIRKAIEELNRLPGIGKKSALRIALHLLRSPQSDAARLAGALLELRNDTQFCEQCGNISDSPRCNVCSDMRRNHNGTVCVVADVRDVFAIERTNQFLGVYHILGGLINPIEGISPSDLNISRLIDRVAAGGIQEVVFALSATPEGETTAFHISRKLEGFIQTHNLTISTIARGAPVGSDLEMVDEMTLARSLNNRTLYTDPLRKTNG